MTDTFSPLIKRFETKGPKRILALDGGGIRGALTLGFLKKIETELKGRHKHLYTNEDDFRMCHYFDLIGGTSTGAIIASALATGLSVDDIIKLYQDVGGKIFNNKYKFLNIWKRWWADYSHKPIEEELQKAFSRNGKEIMFNDQGENGVQTGLLIVVQRADTFSMWPLANNPKAAYYKSNNYPLWELVRCSSAAPTFFMPHVMKILDREGRPTKDGVFVDGGVSMMNNPALQLFLTASLDCYNLSWETGSDKMLIVSVGTGYQKRNNDVKKTANLSKLGWAQSIPDMLMDGSTWHNQLIMQWLGDSKNSFTINRELGDLSKERLMQANQLFTYVRYNTKLETKSLNEELGFSFDDKKAELLRKMDMGENRFELNEIGKKAADIQFKPEHLPAVFDLQELPAK